MKKVFMIVLSLFIYTSISCANSDIALMYNIIPDDDSKKDSVIDIRTQKKLHFSLYSNEAKIFYNGSEVKVNGNKFEIDISKLSGKQEITFTNDRNETATFTYYIGNRNGVVKGYSIEGKQAYVTTFENVKMVYTNKDTMRVPYVKMLLNKMPANTRENLKEITFIPAEAPNRAAGITNNNKVRFYNLSTYTNNEIKRIVFHEVAHTWAQALRDDKIMDYSYTEFSKAVRADSKFVTNYSKNSVSEDFADSIALYLMNPQSFAKNFPARNNYISALI